jgi:hypothetical protein
MWSFPRMFVCEGLDAMLPYAVVHFYVKISMPCCHMLWCISMWRSRCHVAICCGAFPGLVATCVDSLVVIDAGCSLPGMSYISWVWLGLVCSWQIVWVWYPYSMCLFYNGRGASWSDVPRRLWLWGIRRTCGPLFPLCLRTRGSLVCLSCPICAAVAVWLSVVSVVPRHQGRSGVSLLPHVCSCCGVIILLCSILQAWW